MEDIKQQFLAVEGNIRNKKVMLLLTIGFAFISPTILTLNVSKLIEQPTGIFKYFLGLVAIQFLAQIVSGVYIYINKLPNYFIWCVFLGAWLGQVWAGICIAVLSNA